VTGSAAQLPAFDFMDLDFFAQGEPHHVWKELRTQAPVFWHQKPGRTGFWLLTKHADVVAVSRDAATFVSQRGVGPPSPGDLVASPDVRLRPERRVLNLLDPPDHTRMRRIVGGAFSPNALARLEPPVRDFGARVLDEIAPRGRVDFVQDVAARFTLAVLSALMGIPHEDWQRLAQWTADRAPEYASDRHENEAERATAAALALEELGRYLRDLFDARRQEPCEDLISELLALEEQRLLSGDEILWFCLLLVGAGHETVRDALCGGVVALLEHRDQWLRLADDPSLLDKAVEEILRWPSPIIHFGRFVTRDTTIRGQPVRAGQRVLMLYPSANRDEDVFADPDRFDLGRDPNDHVAFGTGHHFCLGASLARLQLRTMIPLVFERLPELELAAAPERLRSNFNAGYARMPVRFKPRR
jgi:cytochrome P450